MSRARLEQFRAWARRSLASARVRIVAWHVLILAVILLVSLVTTRLVLHMRLDERIDREMLQETDELRSLAEGTDPATGDPFGDDVERILAVFMQRNVPVRHETFVTYVDGRPHLRSLNDPPVRLDRDPELTDRWGSVEEAERGAIEREGVGQIAYHAVPLVVDGSPRGVFVSAWFRDLEAAEVDEVILVAGGLSGLALLLTAAILWNVAGRVLRPARAVASTARAITDTDLTRRIDVRGNDEIAEIAETFNAMLDRLEAAFAAQRDFIDDAGHELRTPITIVRGHLELLDLDDGADRQATIELVTDELDRMHRMVEDLLVLAKAQRPDFLRPGPVALHELTTDVFHKAVALAPRDWRLEEVADGEVIADGQRLTQALVQLAQNAAQHTSEGDRIALGSAVRDGQARLWVADSGPGVDPDVAERIFERFARGRSPSRSEGAGLGLSIVRLISEAHGGRVELASTPGGGATFSLVLPVSCLPQGQAAPVAR